MMIMASKRYRNYLRSQRRTSEDPRTYRVEEHDGVVAVVINNRQLLVLQRLNLPLVRNRGVWTFIAGGKEEGEEHLDAAFREVGEEAGIGREDLMVVGRALTVELFDRKKRQRWHNQLFLFASKTRKVRINYENHGYRWISFKDMAHEIGYTNIFINESAILKKIRGFLNGKMVS